MSRKELLRLVKQNKLTRKQDKEGRWQYNTQQLVALSDEHVADVESTDLLEVARNWMVTMESPMRLYVQHLQRELESMRAEVATLRQVNAEMVKARETALTEAYEREVLGIQAEQSEIRKTMATQKGIELVTSIMSEQKANQFIASITTDQIDTLLDLGDALLKPEQATMLAQLKANRLKAEQAIAAAQAAAAAKQATDTEGTEVAA